MDLLRTDRDLATQSYYAATAVPGGAWPALAGDADCDVAVVGGGLAGVSAALELAERGWSVRLLEAQTIGFGASGRNGGQAIHGLACDPATIEQQLGLDDARRVWAMSIEALDLIRDRIRRHGIGCDWRDGWLGVATSARKARALLAWADRIERVYAYRLQPIAAADLRQWVASGRFHGGVHDPRSGHLHPLNYTLGLAHAAAAAGATLHERTPVLALQPGARVRLATAQGTVGARHVLLAGNVYLQGLAPQLAARIMPVGTYVGCTERLDAALADALIPSHAAVCDTNFVLDYFRTTADRRLLYGGRVSYSTVTPADLTQSMRRRMALTFPQLRDARISTRGAASSTSHATARPISAGCPPRATTRPTCTTCKVFPATGWRWPGWPGAWLPRPSAAMPAASTCSRGCATGPSRAGGGCARRRWCWAWRGID